VCIIRALEALEAADVRDRDALCAELLERITQRGAEMRAAAETQAQRAQTAAARGDLAQARTLLY
jgi:hypothetical protein